MELNWQSTQEYQLPCPALAVLLRLSIGGDSHGVFGGNRCKIGFWRLMGKRWQL